MIIFFYHIKGKNAVLKISLKIISDENDENDDDAFGWTCPASDPSRSKKPNYCGNEKHSVEPTSKVGHKLIIIIIIMIACVCV